VVEDGLEEVVEDGLEGGAGAGFGFSPAHAAASPRARPAKITVAAKLLAASMILSVSSYWCVGQLLAVVSQATFRLVGICQRRLPPSGAF
jgi:hypothetical protein